MLMLESPEPRPAEAVGTHGSMLARIRVPSQGRDETVHDVELIAREVDLATCAVFVDGRRRGWIRHVGHGYVALAGGAPDRARECGHALLFDDAAAQLLLATQTETVAS